MRKTLAIAGLCLALVGCVTAQQQPQKTQAAIEHERINERLRAADAVTNKCSDEVKATGILARLFDEILHENASSPNKFKLITKEEFPSKDQIEYLKQAIPEYTKCRTHLIEGYATTPFQTVMLNNFNMHDEIYIKLMRADISIGKANEARANNISKFRSDWAKVSEDLGAKFRAMDESEMAGRRQAVAAMLPYLMQQQQNQQLQQQMLNQQQMQNIINSRPVLTAPTTTNCTTVGSQINCTSR
jgi:hypothetical protein